MSGSRHSGAERSFDLVVVIGSQGALEAFSEMLGSLVSGFPVAILFDLHRSDGQRFTERLLQTRAALPVCSLTDGLVPEPGTVYVSPPRSTVRVTSKRALEVRQSGDGTRWPRDADTLLRSAAEVYGPRLIAVVLSGRLDGGAQGVREVKAHGGRVLVQDPGTATAAGMPSAALASGCVDFALAPESIGQALAALCASVGAAELFRVRLNAGVRG